MLRRSNVRQSKQRFNASVNILMKVVSWILRLLLRLAVAITLLLLLRWIVLRIRRVQIRPTPYTTPDRKSVV